MTIPESILLAIIEGITEFLPISSTGHLIIGSTVMGIAREPFTKMFTVAIQLGAILSVIVLYWKRFFQTIDFYVKLLFGFIPAAVIGLLLGDYIDALLERVDVVGYMLVIGGVFFLFVDKLFAKNEFPDNDQEVTRGIALKIGFFQALAMLPGVSRSAATIIGGLSQKLNRRKAAEFSFFLAVPTMFAATAYKMLQFYNEGGNFGNEEITLLVIGNIVAFFVAMVAIKSFINFLTRFGFKIFGYYRIIVGVLLLALYYLGFDFVMV